MSLTDYAWAAGFFDGEGSFMTAYHAKRKDGTTHAYPQASLGQVGLHGRVLLERFRDAIGFGKVFGPYMPVKHKPHWQPRYQWEGSGLEKVQALLALLWFKLGSPKRTAARVCLENYHASLRRH